MKIKFVHLLLIVVLILIVIPGFGSLGFYFLTRNTFDATINQVNRTSTNGTEILLAEDPYDWGVIRNEDNIFILKMNSGVLSGKLISGSHCRLTTYGWRNTWFSWKPNLVSVQGCTKPN